MKNKYVRNYTLLGKAIKSIREHRGYVQEYVAKKAGIDQSQYSRFEKGELQMYLHKLHAICEALEVSPMLLLLISEFNLGNKIPNEQSVSIEQLRHMKRQEETVLLKTDQVVQCPY